MSDSETYLDQTIIMLEKRSEYENILNGSNYSFPFAIELPSNLPNSYDGNAVRINYFIQGIIDIPWKKDKTSTVPITIFNDLDLNQLSRELRMPYGLSKTDTFKYCCFESEPVVVKFDTLKSNIFE